MAAIIALANQKGGVGKTTSAVNIAAALGKLGKKVLLVDMDPQGNATSNLGISKKEIKKTIYEVLIGTASATDAVIVTKYKNLSIIPSNIALVGAEIDLLDIEKREECAKNALNSIRENYDYIFIDCPPALSMLTVNALVAADGLIIPMQCEYFALEGLSQLSVTIKKVRQHYNPKLSITGILLTMYNGRLNLTAGVVREIKKYYADKLFKQPISRAVKISEAPSYGAPICYHEPYGKGAIEYNAVAKELMLRI